MGRILIAGIGNIFLGDDGFGVAVAAHLLSKDLGGDVVVKDFGIRGYDLAFALMDGYDTAYLVDAVSRGGSPGALFLIEPYLIEPSEQPREQIERASGIDAHSMDPMRVLRMVRDMGGECCRVLIVGCEPATFGPEEGWMGLSEPVEAAVDRAADWIESLIRRERETPASHSPVKERRPRTGRGRSAPVNRFVATL